MGFWFSIFEPYRPYPSFRRDFVLDFKAKKLLETLPQIQQVSTALWTSNSSRNRRIAGENHGFLQFSFQWLAALEVSESSKWPVGLPEGLKLFFVSASLGLVEHKKVFFCCHYIISMWYCKILWDVMKVPGSRQSFPEVLWCGDTHQWCIYIYTNTYTHTYIYLLYTIESGGAGTADCVRRWPIFEAEDGALSRSERHLTAASSAWVMLRLGHGQFLMFQCNV